LQIKEGFISACSQYCYRLQSLLLSLAVVCAGVGRLPLVCDQQPTTHDGQVNSCLEEGNVVPCVRHVFTALTLVVVIRFIERLKGLLALPEILSKRVSFVSVLCLIFTVFFILQ
jgi:hypothetical protein